MRPVATISAPSTGGGYWLAAGDGGVFSFGAAPFHGSAVGLSTGGEVVDLRPTPSGGGYWLAASDGGVFSFGDAPFFGSAADLALHRPVVGMAADVRPTVPLQDFAIAGDVARPLEPGMQVPIALVITNPNAVPLTVVAVRTTLTTSDPACPSSEFVVTQGITRPVRVPPAVSVSLADLGVDRAD